MPNCKSDKLTKQKRITAFIAAIVMMMAVSFSVLCIAENSSHTCSNADCQICRYIDSSLKLFNNLTPDPQGFAVPAVLFFAVVLVLGTTSSKNQVCTLVDLKIKLTN